MRIPCASSVPKSGAGLCSTWSADVRLAPRQDAKDLAACEAGRDARRGGQGRRDRVGLDPVASALFLRSRGNMKTYRVAAGRLLWLGVCGLGAAAPGRASAQSRPFPYPAGYVAGFTPARPTSQDALGIYTTWKRRYLVDDCGAGMYRVEFQSPPGTTVSEGMGYGMLLTVYFGDRREFDGLWSFVRRNLNASGLLGWKVTCAGFDRSVGGSGSATDGDVDIAMALVAAIDQWGEDYRPAALGYLAAVKRHDFTTCASTGRVMATNGDWDHGCVASNSSYWSPGYDRVFAALTHDSFWTRAADDAIALWLASRNPTTGLVGNAVNQDGTVAPGESHVDYNGCRVPWRAVLDDLWYGTPGAGDVSGRIADWVDTRDPARLFDGYETDGTARAGSRWNGSDCFNGGYAVAAMSRSQARVDRFAGYFLSLNVDNYYETSLRALYALMLSGHMWRPGSPAATLPPVPPVLPRTTPGALSPAPVRKGGCGLAVPGTARAWPVLAIAVALAYFMRRRVAAAVARRASRPAPAVPTRAPAPPAGRRAPRAGHPAASASGPP